MMNKEQLKAIRKAIETPGTRFYIGTDEKSIFVTGTTDLAGTEKSSHISQSHLFGRTMNIEYIGATKVDLYTYTMLSKRCTGTIQFEDITILPAVTKA